MLKRLKVSLLATLAAVNVVVIIAMAVLGYAGWLSPVVHPRLAALTLAFPGFVVANVCFLVFWICVKWRLAVLPAVGLLVCGEPLLLYLPLTGARADTDDCIKVVSYNIGGFNGGGVASEDIAANSKKIIDYLYNSQAAIICLQEAAQGAIQNRLTDTLRADYPYMKEETRMGCTTTLTIFSRYPLLRSQTIDYKSAGNLSMAYWLNIDGDTVVVVNNHLETNHLSLDDRANFKEIVKGDMSTQAARGESRMLLGKVGHAASLRAPQADAVSRFITAQRDSGRSVIVCGDFNDNPLSYSVRTIGSGLTDCYAKSGFGPGWSYHKNIMYVRIDHIFCSDEWEPVRAEVDNKIAASDHYPIYCWLKKRLKR